MGLPKAVIFDVDGTLADVSGIRHYVLDDPKRKNFEKFHAAASYCPPNQQALDLVRNYAAQGFVIIVVSARKERWRYRTSIWLRKWEVGHDHLLMRADGDQRKDVEVKRDILAKIRQRYEVVHAVDDNPNVIAMWTAEGIPTTIIPGWDEE